MTERRVNSPVAPRNTERRARPPRRQVCDSRAKLKSRELFMPQKISDA